MESRDQTVDAPINSAKNDDEAAARVTPGNHEYSQKQ